MNTSALPASSLGEWLLAQAFRGLCQMTRAAAQFCGILLGDGASHAGSILDGSRAPELQVLCLSELPLCEIAAAERERIWRVEAVRADGPLLCHPDAENKLQVLH